MSSWVVLALLRVLLLMGRACLRAVYGLRRACARIATRSAVRVDVRCEVSRVFRSGDARAQNSGPFWTQIMILGVLEMVKYI